MCVIFKLFTLTRETHQAANKLGLFWCYVLFGCWYAFFCTIFHQAAFNITVFNYSSLLCLYYFCLILNVTSHFITLPRVTHQAVSCQGLFWSHVLLGCYRVNFLLVTFPASTMISAGSLLPSLLWWVQNKDTQCVKEMSILGLKRVLGYSYSGRCQTSTRYCRPTRVLGIYNDGRKLCCKVACGDYFKAYLTSVVMTVTM